MNKILIQIFFFLLFNLNPVFSLKVRSFFLGDNYRISHQSLSCVMMMMMI